MRGTPPRYSASIARQCPAVHAAGIEYFLERNLAVTFDVKMGPTIDTQHYAGYYDLFRREYVYSTRAYFTLNALVGVAYRF